MQYLSKEQEERLREEWKIIHTRQGLEYADSEEGMLDYWLSILNQAIAEDRREREKEMEELKNNLWCITDTLGAAAMLEARNLPALVKQACKDIDTITNNNTKENI